jgi:hypothetical protein
MVLDAYGGSGTYLFLQDCNFKISFLMKRKSELSVICMHSF